MNAIQHHIFALRISIEQLKIGRNWLYILPAVFIAFLFYGIFSFFDAIESTSESAADIPLLGSYVSDGISKTVGLFFWITDAFYKFLILTLLSPVNCLLSEAVDNQVTGATFDGGIVRILKEIWRAIGLLFFSLLLNFVLICVWYLFAWLTGFHVLDELIYFLITSFFIGFSFYDFSLERYGVGFFGTIEFGFDKMAYMLVTGFLFSLIYLIPQLGLIFAPFLTTIISTVVYLKLKDKIPHNGLTHSNS